jgi:CDP-glycerol glycerophosphotransferase (TagB/SpsB family)
METHATSRPFASLARFVIWSLNVVVPKGKRAVLRTTPDFDATSRVLSRHLVERGVHVTILVDGAPQRRPRWLADGVPTIRVHSFGGLLAYCRSRYIFYTHSLYLSPKPPSRQVVVNLWHGMPLKKIGVLAEDSRLPKFTYTLATSETFAKIISMSFAVDTSQVLLCGLPRNDSLIEDSPSASVHGPFGRPYVVWMPTFRQSQMGAIRKDGDSAGGLPSSQQIDGVVDALNDAGIDLVVKMHLMADVGEKQRFSRPGVLLVDDEWLVERGLTLYDLLRSSLTLVTDYSSVAVDYIVTGRVPVLVVADLLQYVATRGLNFDVEDFEILGVLASEFDSLPAAVFEAIRRTPDRRARTLFYSVPTEGACRSLLDQLRIVAP